MSLTSKPIFYHVSRSRENLGDAMCSPQRFFDVFKESPVQDILDIGEPPKASIVGGGGLLSDVFAPAVSKAASSELSVLWGAGSNVHGEDRFVCPVDLSKFTLVGVRDWKTQFSYVPCPSCLDDVFSTASPALHDIVVYSHHTYPIHLLKAAPTMMNNDISSLPQVVKFLQSGSVVLTNSFHGAYWAMLLGRRVVLFKPFSSRFYGFKWQPPICTDQKSLFSALKKTVVADGYLDECRSINRDFFAKVVSLLA
jgi:hypothetical protein